MNTELDTIQRQLKKSFSEKLKLFISSGKIFSPGADPIDISEIIEIGLIQKQFTHETDSSIKRQSLYPALKGDYRKKRMPRKTNIN